MPVGANRVARQSVVQTGSAIPDSGLVHRYDATSLNLTDGDTVSSWPDEQGTEDLSATNTPEYVANGINGKASVSFNGTDEILNTTFGTTINQPDHIYAVAEFQTVDDYILDGGVQNEQAIQDVNDNFRIFASKNVADGNADTNPHIHNGLYNGGSSEYRVDGISYTGDVGNNNLTGLTLGGRPTNDFNGEVYISEVLIYDKDQTNTEVSETESFLADKWGITI